MNKKTAITDATYQQEVASYQGPHMIEFFAYWCGHCQRMEPIIQEAIKEFENKVKIFQVDVDESPKACDIYNVTATPTMVFLKDGKQQKVLVGEETIETLRKHLTALQ